jgi:hypothetical protein
MIHLSIYVCIYIFQLCRCICIYIHIYTHIYYTCQLQHACKIFFLAEEYLYVYRDKNLKNLCGLHTREGGEEIETVMGYTEFGFTDKIYPFLLRL